MAQPDQNVPVPPPTHTHDSHSQAHDHGHHTKPRSDSEASSIPGMVRKLSRELIASHPPQGFSAVTSDLASTIVAEQHQRNRPRSPPGTSSEETTVATPVDSKNAPVVLKHTEPFSNGYHFPPKYSSMESTKQGLKSFWKFFITPWGFFWTIYGLNVVAWGGMLFLLLCNAAPAMCNPTCDDIDSPRRKWVEYDSQILTALFCVTAFGLAPWRFRDLYYLLRYRFMGDQSALRRLAAINKGWFRLKGSQDLPVDVGPENIPDDTPRELLALPEKDTPNAPLTGTRAPATALWKLDFVIWCMVFNTFAQCGLCGIMWGMNRYERPSWSTGFLVAFGMVIAMVGGLPMFFEGKKVKSIEGVPCTERDLEKLARDKEQGIFHYNNLKGKKPKEKGGDIEAEPQEKSPADVQQTTLS